MNKSRISVAALLALVWATAACDQDLAGLNENPNEPEDVDAALLLPQAIQSSVGLALGSGFHLEFTALFAQHYAKIQYIDEDQYALRPTSIDSYWSSFYSSSLKDFQTVIEKARAAESPNQEAIGRIMRAWEYAIVTDTWGSVPYTAALQAEKDEAGITPTYDSQQTIYQDLLKELAEAGAQIDPDAPSFGSEDLIYGGDMEAWRKFANSLRLRLAMRLSEVDEALAEAEFNAALAAPGGVFEGNEDNAQLSYLTSAPNRNPLYENALTRDDHAVSETLVDMMNGGTPADFTDDDPRLAIFADKTKLWDRETEKWLIAGGDTVRGYQGMPNGLENGHNIELSSVSRIGSMWRQEPDAPAVLMSYAEVLFLQAEAAHRGWTGGSAADLYDAGIAASMDQYGIDAATALPAYYADYPEWAYDDADGLRQIAIQKWIALYANGPEAWAEYRRTGYPVLVPGPAATQDAVPLRIPYPDTERNLNAANLEAAMSSQGIADEYMSPLWWDVDS